MRDIDVLIASIFDPEVFLSFRINRKAGGIFDLESDHAPRDHTDLFTASNGWEIPLFLTTDSSNNGWGSVRGVAVHAGLNIVMEWILTTPEYCDDECDGILEATVFQCSSASAVQARVCASTGDIVNMYFMDKLFGMSSVINRWPEKFISILRNMVNNDTDNAIVQAVCHLPKDAMLMER